MCAGVTFVEAIASVISNPSCVRPVFEKLELMPGLEIFAAAEEKKKWGEALNRRRCSSTALFGAVGKSPNFPLGLVFLLVLLRALSLTIAVIFDLLGIVIAHTMGRRSKNKQAPPQPLPEDRPVNKGKRKAQESSLPAKKQKSTSGASATTRTAARTPSSVLAPDHPPSLPHPRLPQSQAPSASSHLRSLARRKSWTTRMTRS